MKMKKIILPTLITLMSIGSYAQNTKDLFSNLINKSESYLEAYERNTDIDSLSNSALRRQLFDTQSLSILFSKKYPKLESVRVTAKRLEDTIGKYREQKEYLQKGKEKNKSADEIQRRELLVESSRNYLKEALSNGWTGDKAKIKSLRKMLDNIRWDNDTEDSNFAYSSLAEELEKIDNKKWSMDVLEQGIGVHPFRKALREYRNVSGTLRDFIGTRNSCNKGAIHPKDKKGDGRCLVSSCHHNMMVEMYSFFGGLKDEAEPYYKSGVRPPEHVFDRAKKAYTEIKDNKTLKTLAKELKSCKQ